MPCARAFMLHLDKQTGCMADWVRAMLARRHSNVVACALANKLARIAWAIEPQHRFERRTAVTSPDGRYHAPYKQT